MHSVFWCFVGILWGVGLEWLITHNLYRYGYDHGSKEGFAKGFKEGKEAWFEDQPWHTLGYRQVHQQGHGEPFQPYTMMSGVAAPILSTRSAIPGETVVRIPDADKTITDAQLQALVKIGEPHE